MDAVRNPFAPGAGSRPPELAGRDDIIDAADVALQRVLAGRAAQSQMLLGLRGVGKTVLLNKIEGIATSHGHRTSFIEAPEDRRLVDLLYPKMHQILRQLSTVEAAKHASGAALAALRSFASVFKVEYGDFAFGVEAEQGVADSGNIEYDLADMFIRIGEAGQAAGSGWTLLIDEVQYLSEQELAAVIVAIHRTNQKGLPVLFFGAGLPQIAALSGEAKSYAERLFIYPPVGALPEKAAVEAIEQPIMDEGESIEPGALKAIIDKTKGYPYFLQEWSFQAWNIAERSPVTEADVQAAAAVALQRLDDGFFRVRFDRLTPKEREYVVAMSKLGAGPYRSSDVADVLGEKLTSLGPRRATIIAKGMIYSPSHGDIAFTVPMFDEYLKRHWVQ
ncbi:MAG: ATP-binding protein [Methylobacterium mesophilicum]|nr:ATP-binding protein [Methylobacterium mesophilicum]